MVSCAIAVGVASTAPAQECPGDCDGSGAVVINEVLRCVGVALGSAPLPSCPACDADGDGRVPIGDLVAAVRAALDGCPPSVCGDGFVNMEGEECDDGNNGGGDGCAANCTNERRRLAEFDPATTFATVQSQALRVTLEHLVGAQVLTTGAPRSLAVSGVSGQPRLAAGEIPVVIRTGDLHFDPIPIPGSRCACVRGVEAPELGAGNVAAGVIACGASALRDLDVMLALDHDTTPGSSGNGGSAGGLPDDPECDDCAPILGSSSCACEESRDAACPDRHRAVCNSPRVLTRSGGTAPSGSALLVLRIAIGLLADSGACKETRRRDGTCLFADYGPDCLPCTDDDAVLGIPNLVVATTGGAAASVFDANLFAGERIGDGASCGGQPCATTSAGAPFSCDRLAADPAHGLDGGALAVCFPGIDTDPLADTVTCTRLAAQ